MTTQHDKKKRFLDAAIKIWGAKGQFGVTTQAVGEMVGVSKQRVLQVMGTAEKMRNEAAREAIRRGEIPVLMQLVISQHAMCEHIPASVRAKIAEIIARKVQ